MAKGKIGKTSVLVAVMMVLSVLFVPMNVSATLTMSFSDGVNSKEVSAGSSVVYVLRIDNNGVSTVSVNMTATGVPQYWTATFLPSANFTV
ncbi:hypothetical protein DRJ25_05975, partial [Candidatus Woesearchaeota archaeon]